MTCTEKLFVIYKIASSAAKPTTGKRRTTLSLASSRAVTQPHIVDFFAIE
ncbi:hypothetical protein BN938_2195 [Mucinivorans hirudinis]|uniref:Uncharacterized protein n=1 Tax=Mucinivorans hirudinis TaxID=1433126 RepID=A0A060R9K4_9BACT|nr:hypothetical protein BN938_2195 [Mucinivorans hirudinis]